MSADCAHREIGRFCPDRSKDLRPAPIDRRTIARNLARLGLGLGFPIFAVRQFYAGEGRGGWIRAIAAVLSGELALILLVYMPAAMIEQAGLLD